MALHPNFPKSPHAILDPDKRWFPAEEDVRGTEANKLLPPLVEKLRREVKQFRDGGYVGASDTSKSLLNWWFNTEHIMHDGNVARKFEYYFAQREALETIIWLADVKGVMKSLDLAVYDSSGSVTTGMLAETWQRYVIKMATGSGKTKVMSLALAWSYFHKLYEPDSQMSRNFLIIAPNIIVLDRLARDFSNLQIFYDDPVLPNNGYEGQNWQDDFQLTPHRQDEVKANATTGNIFLTNIHRVYDSNSKPPSADDDDTRDYFLGKKPTGETTDSKIELDQVVRNIDELMVINDEAHHVHDEKLAWFQSIQDIHNQLVQKGGKLSMQLDVTATPKHTDGTIFAHTVTDYPLVEAIAQNIVKHPVVPDAASQAKLNENISSKFTEQYADYIDLGVIEWEKTYNDLKALGKKAILFVMVDNTQNCDEVAEYLRRFPEFESDDSVLTIHTNKSGAVSEAISGKGAAELEKLRKLANEIDAEDSPYKAIVSVMMLKEGWDVRNVTTIVGLRAYSAQANILPEQTLGRGLRRMYPERANDMEEYVSVVGTQAFMDFVNKIKSEGVEFGIRKMGGDTSSIGPLVIEVDIKNPHKDMNKLDIELPLLKPRIYRHYESLENLDVSLDEPLEIKDLSAEEQREIEFHLTVPQGEEETEHHKTKLDVAAIVDYRSVIGFFARVVMKELRLVGGYDVLYGKIKEFCASRLFGEEVNLDDDNIVRNLCEQRVVVAAINSFKAAVNELSLKDSGTTTMIETISVRDTRPFAVNNQPYIVPRKSVFNRIAGDSNFELIFAEFLERCDDVVSFAKNYYGINFKLDYIAKDGNIRNYFPDFFVKTTDGEIVIVETKGLADLDVPHKIERLKQWCEDVAKTVSTIKTDFLYVDEASFTKKRNQLKHFSQVREAFTEYHN